MGDILGTQTSVVSCMDQPCGHAACLHSVFRVIFHDSSFGTGRLVCILSSSCYWSRHRPTLPSSLRLSSYPIFPCLSAHFDPFIMPPSSPLPVSNDFHISSESYGGHYMPELAEVILSQNKQAAEVGSARVINFKGFLVGNPYTDAFSNQVRFIPSRSLPSTREGRFDPW